MMIIIMHDNKLIIHLLLEFFIVKSDIFIIKVLINKEIRFNDL